MQEVAMDHPTYKKNVYIYIYMCVCVKKKLYAKLPYCDYLNKNFKHPDMRITKIWVKQK